MDGDTVYPKRSLTPLPSTYSRDKGWHTPSDIEGMENNSSLESDISARKRIPNQTPIMTEKRSRKMARIPSRKRASLPKKKAISRKTSGSRSNSKKRLESAKK